MLVGNIMSSGYRLLVGSPAVTTMHLHRLLVRLAVGGRVRWLMCGNYVDLQRLIYDVAQRAGSRYYDALKSNIVISRAETCYQVASLLRKTEPSKTPTFVSDLLLHFYDEKVREGEATELLAESIQALKRLCQKGPVIVSASGNGQRAQLYATLIQSADRIVRLQEVHNMGHNTSSMTQRVREEHAHFGGFRRALLMKSDQLLFDEMWNSVEAYIPAAEKSSHPLLNATIQMAMMLDQRKLIAALQSQLEMIQHEIEAGHQSQSGELGQVKSSVQRLDDDFEARLQTLRAEIKDMLYSFDGSS
jgi:hypothetical protein